VEGTQASPFLFIVRAAVIVERSVEVMKETMKKLTKAAQVTGLRNLYAEDKMHGSNKKKILYLLTPWSRVLPEKLTGFQLVKKFPAFYWNRKVHNRIQLCFTVRH